MTEGILIIGSDDAPARIAQRAIEHVLPYSRCYRLSTASLKTTLLSSHARPMLIAIIRTAESPDPADLDHALFAWGTVRPPILWINTSNGHTAQGQEGPEISCGSMLEDWRRAISESLGSAWELGRLS